MHETLYDYEKSTRLPEAFVHEISLAQSRAYEAWVKAREESDFRQFQPHLEIMVKLARQKAEYLGYEGSPYNALLEEYERGVTVEMLRKVFTQLAKEQSRIVEQVVNSPSAGDWLAEQEWMSRSRDFSIRILRDKDGSALAGRISQCIHSLLILVCYDVQ